MVATCLAWHSVPANTRLLDQLRHERLSGVTVSRVSKLARPVQFTHKDSVAEAERCCNVKTFHFLVDDDFRLADSAAVACAGARGGA